ncbi:MAG: TonB-dependent receptor [Chitinophagaceae bacterium]|jgi:hypothetical protein|nr:TonB-dependent receptor [Chitinophagaceae bacterium]
MTGTRCLFAQDIPPLQPLSKLIDSVEREGRYRFFFDARLADSLMVARMQSSGSLEAWLEKTLQNTPLTFLVRSGKVYLYDRKFTVHTSLPPDFFAPGGSGAVLPGTKPATGETDVRLADAVIENRLIEIGSAGSGNARPRITGHVRDARSGESLAGAVILDETGNMSLTTDADGYYTMQLSPGRHTLVISHSGMKTTRRQVLVHDNGKLDVDLKENIPTLNAVVVVAEKNSNTRRLLMGVEQVNVRTIKQVPVLLGEPDILRVVMSLPGVTSVGEASTGFNVRGGAADQNLVLFNGATVFNPSHLFGFFTAFNTESVRNVDLYKSSIPAKYGGRLSSVLDIESREGNAKKWQGTAGINFLTAKLSLEGPLVKDKTTLLLGGRVTYSDWLIRQIDNPEYNNSTAAFYDADIHLNHRFSDKDKLSLTVYGSQDGFRIGADSSFGYGNRNAVARWKHIFNNRFSMLLTGGIDQYQYNIEGDEGTNRGFRLDFGVQQLHGRADFTHALTKRHSLEFGAQGIRYAIDPGNLAPLGAASDVVPETVPQEQAMESALYIGDKFTINPDFSIEAGLRYSLYQMKGPRDVFQYVPGLPRTEATITDTVNFGKGENIKTYHGPEWRIAARYSLTDHSSVKAGFNTLRQYLHLLTNTAAISPTDIWKLSDPYIRPQTGYQASAGYYHDFAKGTYESSVELYYKRMNHVLDFKSGASILMNEHPETEVVNTRGEAWGIEFMVRKNTGRLTGWLSYTYSRSFLQMDDTLAGQLINQGNAYPANYDKPHMANLVTNYKFSHRYGVSLNVNYSTGRPITLPVAIFNYAGSQRIYYSQRNQFRIPDYFRIDLAFNLDGNHKVKQKVHFFWTIGAYNLTGRDNPYSIYFTEENGTVKGYQLSVIGAIIPYVTLNMKF